MCGVFLLTVSVLLLVQGPIECIRIRELRVPSHVAEGSEAVLGCKFELHGQRLYSVKWLKDEQEFYHYKPGVGGDALVAQAFPQTGVTVDLARSSLNWVFLVYMSRESAGEYRCEVTGEAPHFKKVHASRNVTVDLLPEGEPQVTGLQDYYEVNQPVNVNCTCANARPDCQVKWWVNDNPAPEYHQLGPWITRSSSRVDAHDTTLQLSFGVMSSHFPRGVMTLTCQAILTPLYQREVSFRYKIMSRAGLGSRLDATTENLEKTTEEPCTSTIKIDIETPNYSLWAPDSASFVGKSFLILMICILLQAVL